jgi:hypothetical protein
MSERLSHAMSYALRMMADARERGHDPHGVAGNTFDEPRFIDGQVWMDWRTAEALERRGLVRIEERTDVYLAAGASGAD